MIKQTTCDHFALLRKNKEEYTLLDVRNPEEYAEGHFQEALNIPLHLLPLKANEMLPDKDAKIIIHCATGGRSSMACQKMEDMGYTNVSNLEGGYCCYTDMFGSADNIE